MTIDSRNWPWLKLPSRLRHYYQQLMLVTNVPCKTARSCEIHTAGAQSRTVTGSAGSGWTLMLYADTLTGCNVMCLGIKDNLRTSHTSASKLTDSFKYVKGHQAQR